MNEDAMKNALRAEAHRRDKQKDTELVGTIIGMVVSIPFWFLSWWAGVIAFVIVALFIQKKSEHNPANPVRNGKKMGIPKWMEYKETGGPITNQTDAKRFYSYLYRQKFDHPISEVIEATNEFGREISEHRQELDDQIEFCKERIESSEAEVSKIKTELVVLDPQSRQHFDARKKLENAEYNLESWKEDLADALKERKDFSADKRQFVISQIEALTN